MIKHRFKILLIAIAYLTGCASDPCFNQVLAEKVNPSKTSKLIYFDRDCGATTGNSNQLSIVSIDDKMQDGAGNIFIASSQSGSAKEAERGVVVQWLNDSTISVKYKSELTIFKKVSKLAQIKVVYGFLN